MFIYIVYWHNRDMKIKRRKILRCVSCCNQNTQKFKNSMNALNDSIQNTNIINIELIDSFRSVNNHKSNGSLDNLINAKHHQGSISNNNDCVSMQGNRATCQTSHSRFEKENQHTTGNTNRNRNGYHNNSHHDKQRRKRIKNQLNTQNLNHLNLNMKNIAMVEIEDT